MKERGLRLRVGGSEEKEADESEGAVSPVGGTEQSVGDIPVPSWAAPLLQTAAVQRLCAITQLGFVARVWPQATHTRYEHSLSCYHLARQAVAHVQLAQPYQQPALFTQEQVRTFLVAALLHDVGHYPFSHSLDGLRSLLPTHERVGRMLIEQSELATILERDYQLVPTRVADLIDPPPSLEPASSDTLLAQLLNGPCDIDKLEYVARDAQACGLSCGASSDPLALLQELHLYQSDAQVVPRLALSSPALPLLRTWIHLRHWLYLHVYWHPTNRTGAAMLTRAVQDALENETLTIPQLQQTDDPGLLALLMAPSMPESTRTLTSLLAMDRLYQPMVEISHQATALFERLLKLAQNARQRKWVEQRLACQSSQQFHRDIAEHELVLDIVPPKQWELNSWIIYQQPPVGTAPCVSWSHALGLSPADLERAASHHCHVRVLIAPHLAPLFQGQERQVFVPLLEQVLLNMR